MDPKPIEDYTPMFIKQDINHPERYTVTAQKWNELWDLVIAQGDNTAEFLMYAIKELVDNVLRKNNEQPFMPLNDYEPATKKYVDEELAVLAGHIAALEARILALENTE
jgi:polyhydroxyalkanoate synthesis regulator phasin